MTRLAMILVLVEAGCGEADPSATPGDGDADVDADADVDGGGECIPEDVNAVLRICRECHQEPPAYGAPMPLMSWDDVHAPAETDPSRAVYELMRERIADPYDPMPPDGDLGDDDRAVLTAWLEAGAPKAETDACADPVLPPEPPPYGPEELPCALDEQVSFTAHANASPDEFHVPDDAGNLYECFTFASPFDGVAQGTAWAPIIDDVRVLHHWILYRTAEPQVDGAAAPCAMPADATFVAGWAPGAVNYEMPANVGLELPGPDDSLILQVHYHNVAGFEDADDASGVAFCTTPTPREHDAGIYTLGSTAIHIPDGAEGWEVTHECPGWLTQFLPEPTHIIATFPHMHELGRTFRTEIQRGGRGTPETLVEVPLWNFESQTFYENEPAIQFNPGDAIRTTCTYDNHTGAQVDFGQRTEDEMCFDFLLVYPISLFQSDRKCVGLL